MEEPQTDQAQPDLAQTDETRVDETRRGPRWFQRVLPVTGLVLAAVALAALLLPAFRDQVALSTSRQPQPYAELYFTQTGRTDAMCASSVRFTVTSHFERTRRLAYRVTVSPGADKKGTDKKGADKQGTVRLEPGRTRQVHVPVGIPAHQDSTVTVRLPALDQLIRAHCSGTRS